MTTPKLILSGVSFLIAAVFAAHAQTPADYTAVPAHPALGPFGAVHGDWELIVGGSGGSNKDFDNSFGGVSAALGYFLNDTLEVFVRQMVSSSDHRGGGTTYDGTTFVALDHHFMATERLRPFVGVNVGALYGDSMNNTPAAGVEGGLKYYLQSKTFVYALVSYDFTFDDANSASRRFDDGAVVWTVGMGLNF